MVTTYDFKKVSLIVDGTYITGFHDGSVVKIEKNSEDVKAHVGAAGDVSFSEINDDTATITVTLKQTSVSLPFLVGLANSKTQFPLSVVDSNTNGLRSSATSCRILKTPGQEYGSDIAGIQVQIYAADYQIA